MTKERNNRILRIKRSGRPSSRLRANCANAATRLHSQWGITQSSISWLSVPRDTLHRGCEGIIQGAKFLANVRERGKTTTIYVFALVPSDTDKPNQFFILTQRQANEGIRTDWKDAVARRKAKGRSGEPADVTGVTWKYAEQHNGGWKALPE